ncbi:MAG: ribokinase [Candidatus Rokubacteria bacterium]|nr:ribokinase [Candidatus Rokubacteria bacterium]
MSSPPRILVVGSANVDFTVAAPRLPSAGETVSEGTLLVNHGGKGANQAVAARRLGADVRLIGCVGDDASGRGVLQALAAEGIGIDGMVVSPTAATGTALIVVDASGRNQIAVAPGANRALPDAHVAARADDFAWADVVICSLEIPVSVAAAALADARRRSKVTILNPAPVPASGVDFWPVVDFATPNEHEAERLSGVAARDDAGVRAAAAALRAGGARSVIVTLGGEGALALTGSGATRVAAFAVDVVDTTAAGDTFNAAFGVALAEGRALEAALRFACAAAALTCTRRGAQASLPARAEVERLLRGGPRHGPPHPPDARSAPAKP